MKHKNNNNNKNKVISALTGKVINGSDAIKTNEAVEYVKKIGYIVIPISEMRIKQIAMILFLSIFAIQGISAKLISEEVPITNFINNSYYNQTFINITATDYSILSYWINITDAPTTLSFFNNDLNIGNWTLDKPSYLTATQILGFGYYNITSFDINNYYLKSNPFGFYNSTTLQNLSQLTDNLGNRGYTNLLNFTNGANYWNNTYATFNKTYANTLYLLKTGDTGTGNYIINGMLNVTENATINNNNNSFLILNYLNSVPSGGNSLCIKNGSVYTSGATCQVSAISYKKNLIALESVMDRFMLITPVRYDYKNDISKTQKIGLIAEDLGNQFPELLVYDNNKKVHTYDNLAINGIFVKAIQEQQEEINNLKTELCLYNKLYSWCLI